jgi:hypothetical protein
MLKKIALIVFLVTCAFLGQTAAQTGADAAKQAAIRELVAIMNSGFKASDVITMVYGQTDEMTKKMFDAMIAENKDFTAEQKLEFEDLFFKSQDNLQKRYQEKFLSRIDINALTDEMIISSYDKHFTLAEIQSFVAFYKSPAGDKLLKLTPVLTAEMMTNLAEKLIPKVMQIGAEIEAEMKREVEAKVKEQTLKKKRTRTE